MKREFAIRPPRQDGIANPITSRLSIFDYANNCREDRAACATRNQLAYHAAHAQIPSLRCCGYRRDQERNDLTQNTTTDRSRDGVSDCAKI